MINKHITVFDFETTGLNYQEDKIIEIAMIKVINGEIIESMNQLINPEKNISYRISELTGINSSHVKGCPTIEQIFPHIISFIGDSLLVAHNALFDLSFLNYNSEKIQGKKISNSFLDTRTLCIDKFPYQSHKLDLMCKKYNINLNNAHRAINDVMATWELLKELDKDLSAKEYINKVYFFKKYGIPEWFPKHANIVGL